MKKVVVVLLSLVVFSCGKKDAQKTFSLNTMKVIMWDMACADELFNELQTRDSTIKNNQQKRLQLYNTVFATNKISKQEFYSNYNYYLNNPPQMKILMDSLQAFSIREKDKRTRVNVSVIKE